MSAEKPTSDHSSEHINSLREELEETYRGILEVFYNFDEKGQLEDVRKLKDEVSKLTVELDETYRGVIELATNLESDEQKIKMVTKGAGLGLWDWDIANGVFNVTDEWVEIVGVNRNMLHGDISDWDDLIHPDDLENVHRARDVFLKGDKMFFHSEHRIKQSNGSWKWFLSNGRSLTMLGDGKPQLVGGSIIDINNRKRTEERIHHTNIKLEQRITERTDEIERTNYKLMEEIREHQYTVQALRQSRKSADTANKAKSVFLANMSHELRTPLHAILGFSQIMQKDPNLTNTQKKNIDIINNSGIYLQGLINDVLEVSKIESGRIALNPITFDFLELLHDIEDMFQARVNEKGLYFRIIEKSNLPQFLHGDEGKLKQVLINLLGNAIKFTDNGGVDLIINYISSKKPLLDISVRDSGMGIEKNDLKKLYQPFEQGIAGINKGGSGLGLVITREFVELMGGKLNIESNPGKGSEFSFSCSFDQRKSHSLFDKKSRQKIIGIKSGCQAKRVLVAEDNDLNRSFLVQTLASMGFLTLEAENGQVALDLFSRELPDVVLMDVRMPILDGKIATQQIRKLDAGNRVPIIYVTASVGDKQVDELFASGADGILYKPFREHELAEILKEKAGAEFIYETENEVSDDNIDYSFNINTLPDKTQDELYQAAINGDIIELRNIISQFKNTDPNAVKVIHKLVSKYDYGKLLELLGH